MDEPGYVCWEQYVPVDVGQSYEIRLPHSASADGFCPYRMWDVQYIKEAQEGEATDFGQVDERSGIDDGGAYPSSAHLRSSSTASC
jgi:hypothetical protein